MAKVNLKDDPRKGDDVVYICTYGFVAGLPQECSLKQARELGLEGELQAAIESGTYVVRKDTAETTPPAAPASTASGQAPLSATLTGTRQRDVDAEDKEL